MVKKFEDEVQASLENEPYYYYDSHPLDDEIMGVSVLHADLVDYLVEVLRWLFYGQLVAIYENLNFYRTRDRNEKPVAPDIAVIKGVEREEGLSWTVGPNHPAPHVVFEIASAETWKIDLEAKPEKYGTMGVEEYYVYDPNLISLWHDPSRRLLGWRLDQSRKVMMPMPPDVQGRLWSTHLNSWLVPDGKRLRLYDRDGHLRLTREEAQERRADAEAMRAQAEAQRARVLAEKLRSLGINPDEL